jgi:hypothetical protein
MGSWEIFKSGDVEDAIKAANLTGGFEVNNKVIYLLYNGSFDQAIELAKSLAHQEETKTDTQFINIGIGNWLFNNKDEAIRNLLEGLNSDYTDAAGGVVINSLLYVFSKEAKNESIERKAKLNIANLVKKSDTFPSIIGKYLLGVIDKNNFLANKEAENPILISRYQSKKMFYVWFLEMINGEDYTKNLELSVPQNKSDYLEREAIISYWMYKRLKE